MFTNATFRAAFPEFADIALYPDSQLTFWGSIASQQVNANRWQNMALNGIYLYVAHEITMASRNETTAGVGGMPGTYSGIMNNKSVGSVSSSYDTASVAEKDGGWWNLTNYGRQFIRLARIFGAGPVQL